MPDDVAGAALVDVRGTDQRRHASRRILGLNFFCGDAAAAVERMRGGGLLVVPAAPALVTLESDKAYREALLEADLAIPDSSYMVLLWNLLEGDSVRRLSGLEYFDRLIADPDFRADGNALFIMPSEESARRNVAWLGTQGIALRPAQVYVAPIYRSSVVDLELVARVKGLQPRHVVVAIGGGVQERLGLYLKHAMDYRPSIHCIGAAIAFRSGDQVYINRWADRFALGWFLRCLWRPKSYVPRYWAARRLGWHIFRYRTEMPPLEVGTAARQTESSASVA